MASLKLIKKRIASVKNTQKITRAMKLVSAAKLRRATERAQASRPYEQELIGIVSNVFETCEWASPLNQKREMKKTALVVISTDRGLCGSLNSNNFKQVLRRIQELPRDGFEIIAFGKKAADFFKRRGYKIHSFYQDLSKSISYSKVSELAGILQKGFVAGDFDRVEIFYSRFESALVQKPTGFLWLPFVPPNTGEKKSFIFEPGAGQLLDVLVPELLNLRLYRALLESIASEFGARMTAMESATKNAKDVINGLTLERNRARQAAITKELMEIIGGAEALSA